jgi:hypothetical protein
MDRWVYKLDTNLPALWIYNFPESTRLWQRNTRLLYLFLSRNGIEIRYKLRGPRVINPGAGGGDGGIKWQI